MPNFFRNLFLLSFSLFVFQSCNSTKDEKINVTLFSSFNSLQSEIEIKKNFSGQKYLQISFTNKGNKIDYLDSISVIISPPKEVSNTTKLIFGGTCMGRTPISQTIVSDKVSKSDTFQMLQLDKDHFSITGILTWNTFLPYLFYDLKNGIIVKANGEGKPIKPGETIEFEKILLDSNNSWQDLLFEYGEEIAKEHDIEPKEPIQLKGWSTWDYYGRVFDTKDVIKNIDQLTLDEKDANIIQIDGGWWIHRGDYLSVRDNLQGGMKAIAEYAKSKGYRAGIHLDGFRADKKSDLYKSNPDWFLKDQDGEVVCYSIDKGDTFMEYIYFDYSNPAVCAYMKNVLKTIRTEWGFSYFKIDFMRYGLLETILEEHGVNNKINTKPITKILSFNNNMTSVQRTRAGLKAMREGIDEGFFLACSSIFGPTLGIVDGLRTGQDISPTFDYYKATSFQNAGNFYLNHTVVQNDADYLVVRNSKDEEPERAWGKTKFGGTTTLNEAEMWSNYISLFGGIKISSDNLITLRDERKKLITNAFKYNTARRFIPLDLWDHAMTKDDTFNIMLAENVDGVYLALFNWDDNQQQFLLDGFGKSKIINPESEKEYTLTKGKLNINLKKRSSIILKVEGGDFDVLRKSLHYKSQTKNLEIINLAETLN